MHMDKRWIILITNDIDRLLITITFVVTLWFCHQIGTGRMFNYSRTWSISPCLFVCFLCSKKTLHFLRCQTQIFRLPAYQAPWRGFGSFVSLFCQRTGEHIPVHISSLQQCLYRWNAVVDSHINRWKNLLIVVANWQQNVCW